MILFFLGYVHIFLSKEQMPKPLSPVMFISAGCKIAESSRQICCLCFLLVSRFRESNIVSKYTGMK